MIRLVFVIVLASVAVAQSALGVDGVVEINQASALAGGVTPSDTPGYPVTIDVGGSYKLTSNLINLATSDTIQLRANLITLDLNGFHIQGGNPCGFTSSGVVCTVDASVGAINGLDSCPWGSTIRNGSILNAVGYGIALCASSRIEAITVIGASKAGLLVQHGSIIERCNVVLAGNGIQAPDSRVFDSVVRESGSANRPFASGISGNPGVVAVRNNQLYRLHGNAYFENHRVLGTNLCDGVAC